MIGIVKFFKKSEGWGFVVVDGHEYFVHSDNIDEQDKVLYRGEQIEFDLVDTVKGGMAVNVRRRKRSTTDICDGESAQTKEEERPPEQEA